MRTSRKKKFSDLSKDTVPGIVELGFELKHSASESVLLHISAFMEESSFICLFVVALGFC